MNKEVVKFSSSEMEKFFAGGFHCDGRLCVDSMNTGNELFKKKKSQRKKEEDL